MTIKIYLNGKEKIIPKNTTIQNLISELNIKNKFFAIEINNEIIQKEHYDKIVKEEDNIEVVTFFGGG